MAGLPNSLGFLLPRSDTHQGEGVGDIPLMGNLCRDTPHQGEGVGDIPLMGNLCRDTPTARRAGAHFSFFFPFLSHNRKLVSVLSSLRFT